MGARKRSFANNLTTSGVLQAAAVNNASLSGITDIPSGAKGKLVLISTQTASSDASISFTSGIDSTYKTYLFVYNFHSSADAAQLGFQASTNGGSSYGVTTQSTNFIAIHNEADTDSFAGYQTSRDLTQSTSYGLSTDGYGNDNDQNGVGEFWLFNPSSTTYVKHFIHNDHCNNANDYACRTLGTGYFNTTSAINAIDFKFNSGNIDAGSISMYGIA